MLPNFLIAGTVRAATTSLHYYLPQHPDIAMSELKEPNFFLFDPERGPLIAEDRIIVKSVRRRREYEELFDHAGGRRAVGEASPLYLYPPETPELIAATLDDPKVIAVLREPVDRAWSHFLHLYRGDPAEASERFKEATTAEMSKRDVYEPYRAGSHFLRIGLYSRQIERYEKALGSGRLHWVLYEDVGSDPASVLAGIAGFLGVDASFSFDTSTVYNKSGVAKNALLGRARAIASKVQPYVKAALPAPLARRLGETRARLEHRSLASAPEVDEALQRELRDWFADDVHRTSELTGRDLGSWLR